MRYEPSFEYRESEIYQQDLIAEHEAQIKRSRKVSRTAKAIVAFTATTMIAGLTYDAINDTTRYENGLECSGIINIAVSAGEKLTTIAGRDANRLGLSQSSASKLLNMYIHENSPFSFTYDKTGEIFIFKDTMEIKSAETCTD
jgi:hypothetical protein